MKLKLSHAYVNALFAPGKYENIVEISALLAGSESFDRSAANYGLPSELFVICESLAWFAQSVRSGARTYFEATPSDRQAFALNVLVVEAPTGFAKHYSFGVSNWQDEGAMRALDRWIEEHDEENNRWLWGLAQTQRETFLRAVA